MSLHEDLTPAERDFLSSRGRNADALLAENKDGIQRVSDETPAQAVPAAGDVGSDASEDRRPSVPRVDGQQPPPTQSVESADKQASPVPFEDQEEPVDPQVGHPKRVSWPKYQRAMDAHKAAEDARQKLEQERLSWIEERAAVNERLRLFNEALKDDQPQVEEDPRPDPMQDAYAAMEWDRRRADKLEAELNQWRQQQEQLNEEQQFKNFYAQSMQNAATQYPILAPAYHYLIKHRSDELAISRPDLTDEQRQSWLQQEEAALARRELSQGRNPASLVYQLAKSRGFEHWYAQQQSPAPAGGGGVGANGVNGTTSPPAAQAAPAPSNNLYVQPPNAQIGIQNEIPTAVQQVQAIAANQNAARSLSNGGGAPLQNIDARALANMSPEEFEAVFSRLQNSRNKAQLRELMGY